jgi:hypothetical protein
VTEVIPPPPAQPVVIPAMVHANLPLSSLAPTASDWNEFGSPSFLETMKRTRPTSAWTGVALFVAGLTFIGGIAVGRGTSPAALPVVPVPAPLPTSVAAPAAVIPSPASTATTAEAKSDPVVAAPAKAAPIAPSKALAPFDAKAARAAVDAAAAKTKSCRQTTEPKGAMATTITFAPTGSVSQVTINTTRYAGTKTGQCITARLSEAKVQEFSGKPGTLKKTVTVR